MNLLARKALVVFLAVGLVAWGCGAELAKTIAPMPGAPLDSAAKQELEDPEVKPKLVLGSRSHRKLRTTHATARVPLALRERIPARPLGPGLVAAAPWLAHPPLLC